jgi:hypothetical protein
MGKIKDLFKDKFVEDGEINQQHGSPETGPWGGDPAMSQDHYNELLDEIDAFIEANYKAIK